MNLALRITPFGGFDIPGLEGWLSSMAAKGLRFSMAAGPLVFFDRVPSESVQIHLEPILGRTAEDAEVNAIYEDAGWQYWGMFRGSYFVYASSDLKACAHTDSDALDYALKKFFRQKLAGGVLLLAANLLLLGLYWKGAPWEIDLWQFRYYPVETLSNGTTIPFLLAMLGFLLMDLSYLLGLFHLMRYRRMVQHGGRVHGCRGIGWLLAVGWLFLLPVLVNTIQLFSGTDYRPYALEGSGFVTLTDIEGEGVSISQRQFYYMDYISHGGTLLDPEYWYFQQYGTFGQNKSPDDVPHLKISIVRYPLDMLAEMRTEEWSRQYLNGSGDFETLPPDYGLDEIRYAPREERTYTSEITGETRVFLPGGILIVRRGNTVLFADYYGEQNLTKYLEQFANMLERL